MATDVELKEAQDATAAAQKELADLKEAGTKQTEEIARHREAALLSEATTVATEALGKVENLPPVTRTRLVESLAKDPPTVKDGDKEGQLDREAYANVIEEAAKAEVEYLAELTKSGKITNMGGGGNTEDHKTLEESWRHLHPDWTDDQIAIATR